MTNLCMYARRIYNIRDIFLNFCCFFCLGCNNFCYYYDFLFFPKYANLFLYLVKIFFIKFYFLEIFTVWVLLLWMSVYRYIFWCNFFYIIHYRKTKLFLEKASSPFFQYFWLTFYDLQTHEGAWNTHKMDKKINI